MDAKITGGFIAELRKETGMTQKQLAETINVTDKAISRWETGKGFPDISSLMSVSELFSVSINELLIGQKIEPDEAEKAAEESVVSVVEESLAEKSKFRKIIVALIIISIITAAVAFFTPLFFIPDLSAAVTHKIEGGYTVITLTSDTVDISDYRAIVYHEGSEVKVKHIGDGLYFKSDYGEYRGLITITSDNPDINGLTFEFGFVSSNNWHKNTVNLRLDITGDSVCIEQNLTLLTDGDYVTFRQTRASAPLSDLSDISVFAEGIA